MIVSNMNIVIVTLVAVVILPTGWFIAQILALSKNITSIAFLQHSPNARRLQTGDDETQRPNVTNVMTLSRIVMQRHSGPLIGQQVSPWTLIG